MGADQGFPTHPVGLTEVERAVLRHIRLNPGKSRVEIATDLDLSKSMLTKAVAKFEQANLIVEERTILENGERGQPPIKLSLNDAAFHSIGVYVNRGCSVVVSNDLSGKVHQKLLREQHEDSRLVSTVLDDIAALIAGSPVPILGVGHAVHAIVGGDGKLFEVTPSQAKLPLSELAAAIRFRFSLPVYWENAAYCVAGFEANRPRTSRRCVFHLTLGYGIGGCLVADGSVFRGAYNQAGNIGSLIPETGPRPNIPDLAKHLGCSIEALSEAFVASLFHKKDPDLLSWIDDRGHRLSEPLAAAVQLVNPDAIIVGGFFPREVLEEICSRIDLDVLDIPGRRPLMKPALTVTSLLGPSGFAEAAALLPIAAQLLGKQAMLAVP